MPLTRKTVYYVFFKYDVQTTTFNNATFQTLAVRSLASVALRKSVNSKPGYHFDYFTIDFNEELSAFNGAVLNIQMQYVNSSIYHILNLYRKHKPGYPKSVILVGHSMVRGINKHRHFLAS